MAMNISEVKFASLNDERLATLKALEKELGVYLLALEPDTLRLAELKPEQIKKLQTAEEKLGVMLIAYKTKA
jgi:hypothetical protein